MSDLENARARTEALSAAPAMSSADRARLWAGMNRYLAAEAQIAHSAPTNDEETRTRTRTSRSGFLRPSRSDVNRSL